MHQKEINVGLQSQQLSGDERFWKVEIQPTLCNVNEFYSFPLKCNYFAERSCFKQLRGGCRSMAYLLLIVHGWHVSFIVVHITFSSAWALRIRFLYCVHHQHALAGNGTKCIHLLHYFSKWRSPIRCDELGIEIAAELLRFCGEKSHGFWWREWGRWHWNNFRFLFCVFLFTYGIATKADRICRVKKVGFRGNATEEEHGVAGDGWTISGVDADVWTDDACDDRKMSCFRRS